MSKSLYQTNVESRAPLTTDVGVVGNWWVDTSASPADLYLCTGATGGVYTWTKQGGGSSGKYQHNISFSYGGNYMGIQLINDVSSAYTTSNQVASAINTAGYTSLANSLPVSTMTAYQDTLYLFVKTYYMNDGISFQRKNVRFSTNGSTVTLTTQDSAVSGVTLDNVNDTVVAL